MLEITDIQSSTCTVGIILSVASGAVAAGIRFAHLC